MAIWERIGEPLKKIHAAIRGNFGAQDQAISADDVGKFQQRLQGDEKSVDSKIYPDAGHGFENPNHKGLCRAADAADAWNRTVNFLATTLKK